eukprot:COSAG04_NODE_21078_length_380_cov_1.014235_1_plen_22_part_10
MPALPELVSTPLLVVTPTADSL